MKRNILAIFILSLLLQSCFVDKGNYSYKEINEVTIEGVEEFYRVEYPDGTLEISPIITSTESSANNDRYTYEWKAVGSVGNPVVEVLSTELSVSGNIPLLPGTYTLYFKVTDKETGLVWKTSTSLNVATGTSRGFLLAGNDPQGYFRLDMVRMPASGDTIVSHDLLRNANIPPFKDATGVMFTGGMANMNNSRFWVMGKNHSYYINRTTFLAEPGNVFRPLTFTLHNIPSHLTVADVAPRVSRIGGTASTTSYRAVSTQEGYVFYSTSITMNGDVYGNPVNRTNANSEEYFKASPYLMYSLGYYRGLVVYDTDNDRFTFCSSFGTTCTVLSDKPTDLFPWNQGSNGRKLVYAENSRNTLNGASNGNSFALMQDQQEQYHIYMINAAYLSSAPNKTGYYLVDKTLAPGLDQAVQNKLIAFASFRTVMIYASGNNLYYYDYNKGNERGGLLKSFDNTITMIQFDIQTGNNGYRDLYVATRDGSGVGTLQKLVVGNDVNSVDYSVEENTTWTGLCSVVRMDWRNQE